MWTGFFRKFPSGEVKGNKTEQATVPTARSECQQHITETKSSTLWQLTMGSEKGYQRKREKARER